MDDIIQEVLKYCKDEYNYIVLAESDEVFNEQFWTLEKTEEDAINRVKNETEGYGGEDESPYKFKYHALERKEMKYHRKPEPVVEVRIVY